MSRSPFTYEGYQHFINLGVEGEGVWDDLQFAVQLANPVGLASDPSVSTDDGTLLFSHTIDNVIFVTAQIPHRWKEQSAIVPHIHWSKTTSDSGNVAWLCEYQAANVGSVFAGSWTELATVTSTVAGTPDTNTADKHLISSFGNLDMTGLNISAFIKFRITRVATAVEDTYGADAKVLGFDCHYRIDTNGSLGAFEKHGI